MRMYRRFEKDVWGYCFTDEKIMLLYEDMIRFDVRRVPSWWTPSVKRFFTSDVPKLNSRYLSFFFGLWAEGQRFKRHRTGRYVYSFDYPIKWRYARTLNARFISISLTKLYFITFQDHQFSKMFRMAAKKEGNFETNYLKVLECRSLSISYRLNFSPDIFWLICFVKASNVIMLGRAPISSIHYLVPMGLFFTVVILWRWKIMKHMLKSVFLRTMMFPSPKFLFSSYKCFFFYLVRFPRRSDLVYPFSIDLQSMTGFY